MVWTVNKESMQTKSWLTDQGRGRGCAGREAVTSVLNYREVYDVLTLVGEQLMEECIIIKAKADMSWKDRSCYNS